MTQYYHLIYFLQTLIIILYQRKNEPLDSSFSNGVANRKTWKTFLMEYLVN